MKQLAGVALAICSTGCATIFGFAGDQHIKVISDVPGARIFVDGKDNGTTPGEATMTGRSSHFIRLERAGYEPYEVQINQGFNPLVIGNILLGGIVGILVDVLDGAAITAYPGHVTAKLKPALASSSEQPNDQPHGNIGPEYNTPMTPPPGWDK